MYEQNPATTKPVVTKKKNKTILVERYEKTLPQPQLLLRQKTLHKCTTKTLPHKTSCEQLVHQKSALVRHKNAGVRQKRGLVVNKKFIKRGLDRAQ